MSNLTELSAMFDFLAQLRRRLDDEQLTELTELPQLAEGQILSGIQEYLTGWIVSACNETICLLPNGDYESKKGQLQVNLAPSIGDPNQLEIALFFIGINLDKGLLPTKTTSSKVNNIGAIQRIRLTWPKELSLDGGQLQEVISQFLNASYNVLGEVLASRIKRKITRLGRELYLTFRSYCTNSDVKDKVWFAGIADGQGFRIPSDDVAVTMISSLNTAFTRGTASLATELIDTAMPIDGLLMKSVFNTSEPFDVDINNAEYDRQKSSYSEAMRALYGPGAFTIIPIYSDGSWAILALVDVKVKNEACSIFFQRKDEFTEICKQSRRKLSGVLESLTKRRGGIPWKGLGELIGNATSSFVKGIASP